MYKDIMSIQFEVGEMWRIDEGFFFVYAFIIDFIILILNVIIHIFVSYHIDSFDQIKFTLEIV
jgi:hypothetical protein